MKIGIGASQVALVVACALLPAVLAKLDEKPGRRVAKQIHGQATVVDSEKDHSAAETGFGGAGIGGHGKYFQDFYMLQFGPQQIEFGHVCENPDEWEQRFERKDMEKNRHQGQVVASYTYQHNPEHDHYEFGYRRGNDHHFQERYEKAHPHAGHFKTKVRWGDKHGGYGEHYWDYNHAGHHGDDHGDEGGDGGYSEPVPNYQPAHHAHGHSKVTAKRQSPAAAPAAAATAAKQDERVKRQQQAAAASSETPRLVYDVATGTVVDEATGQAFLLTPVQ